MSAPVFLTTREVLAQYARVSRGHLYVWIKRGLFPPPVRMATRRIAWRREDLERWAASREVRGQVSSREVV